MKAVSQRTIVELKNLLGQASPLDYYDLLYARDFPDWFVIHCRDGGWDWMPILFGLRNGNFFFLTDFTGHTHSLVPEKPTLSQSDAKVYGEWFLRRLAAFATTLPASEALLRSLQLDGFDVDTDNLKLIAAEGPVSASQEEDAFIRHVKSSGLPNGAVVAKHSEDAFSLFAQGKDHSSLGESRNLLQSLIDDISTETAKNGKHTVKLPGGTSNRIGYLKDVGFLTPDEQAAFNSAWGTLSAGSHPGVTEREQARIGLILALEFGQLLLLKFANWKKNAYEKFS